MGKYNNPNYEDKVESVETPKTNCSCGAAGCGGRDIYCKVHGKKWHICDILFTFFDKLYILNIDEYIRWDLLILLEI